MRKEFNLGTLVEEANRSRHIDTTAEHVAAMIDAENLDLVVAIWTDPEEPGGVATLVFKGADLFPYGTPKPRKKTLKLNAVSFWLRNKAHADAIGQELEERVKKDATVRGEFAPIGDDVAFEAVPNYENPENLYVVKGGLRVARRGRPGTREAKRWVPLFPGYLVRDLSPNRIEIEGANAEMRFGLPH